MAEITASLVKQLREKTGAGMMDCKKALAETDADLEAAVDWLRKKGLSQAAKKSGRTAAEGLVAVATEGAKGAIVEINAETDFVSRNETFQEFVETAAKLALAHDGAADKILKAEYPGKAHTLEEELTNKIATIGENMAFRRANALSVSDGVVASYIHSAMKPNLGKIGVLVALESTGDKSALETLGRNLAMHIAAAKPEFLTTEDVDSAALEREREVLTEQARASGKPENIIEKMVEGRLRKYYEEVVLLEQIYMIDGESKVSKVVEAAEKEAGAPITLKAFECYRLGEGIEKQEDDFAAEVAAAMKG
ncbi:MAG: translation elongation factor Ts [Marivibrio sp.]|uniref:translation elongation factor Ts n=1 Tax=Marivibrio sp. TaxID=2039719 RepID=UPI0032EC7977